MRPEPRTRRISGFAVAWMLVLVAIIALASGAALHDVLFAQQLATTRGTPATRGVSSVITLA